MDRRQIIMNYSVPPGVEDMQVIAEEAMDVLPEELLEFSGDVCIAVEDFPDPSTETELDLDDPYDLLALYRSGREISPGVEKKISDSGDVLVLYRRPILDLWCETGDDLNVTVRQVMIEELGRAFEFSDQDIEDMIRRHFQGML